MLKRFGRLFSTFPIRTEKRTDKLTVLLDLDDTLCYTFYPTDYAGFMYQPDIKEDAIVEFPEQKTLLYIYRRPQLDEFLEHLGKYFDPVLYSSGIPEYVDLVAKYVDPNGICRTKYSQAECSYERPLNYPQFEWVKDMSKLQENPARTVVVDDDWKGMFKQPDNYISIERWEAWYEDDLLMNTLLPTLEEMKDIPDVRPYLRAKYMHKYLWADQERFYSLTDEDNEFAKFMAMEDSLDYEKIYSKYMELFINPTVFTEAQMW
mmetsp:Transcript_9917/g.19678  ORF Transcript_9917/g.19678 Transcript_9917/m.19678 type:complete len:262 (-) Transcript_9917:38-823(-)|eukprot:CAMPEP_0204896248 /NCGR_PEP_ID=MMETSP1397-20131031/54_1 /ASSEMBLY_ACC=CAM_ASM_000891 /TAXON_ID=49980 /ORGANISM="Climacostomum Climacostomum virens, Strain Stock W-24" /LENGTH=261 /DNA_ID=CAMNT_0052063831 /DNA_START=101 /DNA_END=886 /DNA_ORIENTATION=+